MSLKMNLHPSILKKDKYGHQPVILQMCADGNLVGLKRAVAKFGEDINLSSGAEIIQAAANGHLAVVRWLVEDCHLRECLQLEAATLLRTAGVGGHAQLLRWLLAQQLQVDVCSSNVFRFTADQQQHECIQILLFESGQLHNIIRLADAKPYLPENLIELSKLLDKFEVFGKAQLPYLLSDVCRQAVSSGLIQNVDQLQMLQKNTERFQTAQKHL